ncbi:ABC transporter permease [Burkholderiaceae bacterium FT117]|uniref:ABC transporter permease n=1 Tax=Zeimonas sediminis TaxID=2944268 RepID=UPI0023430FEC|nr:ABC transporter permease [Zeimonas sediminis]MCM5572269.1 ABC transporter permease [Zeimonas sediminis]
MSFLLRLAALSAWNRRSTLVLTILSIALSTFMLLGVERVRTDLRASFGSAISGTDLIVGARTGSVQLLLFSVFHVGAPTSNIGMRSVEAVAAMPSVAWVVPISLGDSHRGFPVVGTTTAYFERFRYGSRQALRMAQGEVFSDLFDAVVGAEVAARLGYRVGDSITLAHGSGPIGVAEHADKPFRIAGILARTGTPVDRSVLVSLEAIEAIHADWMGGMPRPGSRIGPEQARALELRPKAVTAALVGLERRSAVFATQRRIDGFDGEPLMAILPGVALDELWQLIGAGERALLLMSGMVALVSFGGLVSVILAGLNERRRELAVLRAAGAGPRHVLGLLALEGGLVTLAGVAAGAIALSFAILALAPWLQSSFGLTLEAARPTTTQWLLAAALVAAGWFASLLPAWRAYRLSLSDGLSANA